MADAASAPAEAENIAVCIRVRPMNEREMSAHDAPALTCVPALNVLSLTDPATGAPLSGKGNVFQYDQIFDAVSDSHAIYERVARRIVRSTLGGINGTIFAYGQTSSGKTYTMQGDGVMPFEPEAESCRPGILQLAVEDIFSYIESCVDRDFLLRVSFLEIYNEVVKDLLNPCEKGANLKLREDPRKGVYVECREEIITNYEDIVRLLQTGNRNRTTGQTAMNDKSSRSHSVFRIVIESKEKSDSRRHSEEDVNGAVLVASLNLVDLAGSESLRHTGAEGIRQREAGNINKSLLTLARVINSLASCGGGGQNAPFRDSKLTRLLQNSLGGNTRTLIICCVTPSDRYIEETKSTLQFAARAKNIHTTATVNEVLDDQTQLRRLKREVRELKNLVNCEALNALKAENEALISEKNHNKAEMARLMGLMLSGSSVTKVPIGKKHEQRGKRMRETWGPGDFPTNIKALSPFSPNFYPRKRHSPAKENVNPQTLFRVYEEMDKSVAKEGEHPALAPFMSNFKPKRTDLKLVDNSKLVLDLFSAVFQSYRDGNCGESLAAVDSIANEKSASLGDMERARVFDVLVDIKSLMVANNETRVSRDDKRVLEKEVDDLRAKLNDEIARTSCDCSGNTSKAGALVEEIMVELVSTREVLAKEEKRCQDLKTEKTNCQQMAAEEVTSLRSQLEALQFELKESHRHFDSEKRELEAALEALQSRPLQSDTDEYASLRTRKSELESLVEEMKASQTVLHLAVAERDEEIASLKSQGVESNQDEEQNEAQQRSSTADQASKAVANQLAGDLQEIMQELAQLRSDQETTVLEKEELQAEIERVSEELEISRHQGYEMSETLMEKEHIAKVLQAQLDAKLMTISLMQTRHSVEVQALEQSIQDLTTEKEQLLAKNQEGNAIENPATDDGELEKPELIECITAKEGEENVEGEPEKLPSEVEQLTEKLSAIKSEFAEMKERLETSRTSSEDSPGHSELKAAFDKLKADFSTLQQENKCASDISLKNSDLLAEVPSSEDQIIELPDQALHQQYDSLMEDYKRLEEALEKVSCERNDCLDELQALESQLMEVSKEKMKLAVTAGEQEKRLRDVKQAALSSSKLISTLQVQLEEAHSANVTLEASKTELEQSAKKVHSALTALQADHAAIVEEMQQRETLFKLDNDSSLPDMGQLQQRLEIESKQCDKLRLDVQSYEETLSMMRKEAKDNSAKIADLLEKMKMLETDLEAAARTQEQKDKELAKLANVVARSEEEQQEMRLQSKQRLVAAEKKEIILEEKIAALEQQVRMSSTGTSMVQNDKIPADLQVSALEHQLAEAHQALQKQDETWSNKQAMAERKFECLMTEQKQLREQLSALQNSVEASQNETKARAEELAKAHQSCAELLKQQEAVERELGAATVTWEEKQQKLLRQVQSAHEQSQEVQSELEEYQKNADDEIHRLRSVIERSDAEIEELKRSVKAREEELETRMAEQEDWQDQVKTHQEALQTKCDELDDERRHLKEKYAVLEAQHGGIKEQLQNEIQELSQKLATAQAQKASYQAKLKEMEAHMEMTENEVVRIRGEVKRQEELLKASQMEAVQYHNKLVEARLANESMEKLVEKQKARIDKLDKVKMTMDVLDMFRRLKKDRQDLQDKVQELQKELVETTQASKRAQETLQEKEQRLVEHKEEELKMFEEQNEEFREALRVEKHQAANLKAELRAALNDEREKAEHEIQEMQALVKEKMELVEKLESHVASVEDAMTKLREQKNDNVSYLEKENLELHVENRELKKRLESAASLPEKSDLMGDTGTYDASAAAAAKMLGEDNVTIANESEVDVTGDDTVGTAESPTKVIVSKAGGFLLSTTELDAIAAESQEEPKEGEALGCPQQ